MPNIDQLFHNFFLDLKIGFFLAVRQVHRASKWTTGLIIIVMTLTFLNLVVVTGILVGIIFGANQAVRDKFIGDVIVSPLDDKDYIEDTNSVRNILDNKSDIKAFTERYRMFGSIEANYRTRNANDAPNLAGAQIVGINPENEDAVTHISEDIIAGSFLEKDDVDKIVIGNFLLKQYAPIESPLFTSLENVEVGTKVRVKTQSVSREMVVKGIIKTKVDEVSMSAFINETQAKAMFGRNDGNKTEIAIRLEEGVDPNAVRDEIKLYGVGKLAKVQTFEEGQPKFLKDMIKTFNMLGALFSSFGLIVAAITVFIVIFINAFARRRYIGILKGIGINERAIELAYVFQSCFYAVCGASLGILLVYTVLVPFFVAHPIDFPFSDGILVAPLDGTLIRGVILIIATIIAGYVPARMIVRKNTLDSILGRN